MKPWNLDLVRQSQEWGETHIRPTLFERDRLAAFDPQIWSGLSEKKVFAVGRKDKDLDLRELASVYFGLAKGSMDLPLVCSFAAHGVIARDLLLRFGTADLLEKYLAKMESGQIRAGICNSEPGAGTDLRKIRSQCLVTSPDVGTFTFAKPCVTNGFNSSLYFVSAWEKAEKTEPRIAVYVVESTEAICANLASELGGFRTGLTGSVKGHIENFPFHKRRLAGNAFKIFRQCFNLERFFIGVIAAGVLQGMEDEARRFMAAKAAKSPNTTLPPPWVQDKMVRIACARTKVMALVERVLAAPEHDLDSHGQDLAVLKMLINEEVADGVTAFFELSGHQAMLSDHLAQKLLRDFSAFRFFGGTTELQKMALFAELTSPASLAQDIRKAG